RVPAGQGVALGCWVVAAEPPRLLRVEWLKGAGQGVLCSARMGPATTPAPCVPGLSIAWEPPNAALSIQRARPGDAGCYVCRVTLEIPRFATATGNGTVLTVSGVVRGLLGIPGMCSLGGGAVGGGYWGSLGRGLSPSVSGCLGHRQGNCPVQGGHGAGGTGTGWGRGQRGRHSPDSASPPPAAAAAEAGHGAGKRVPAGPPWPGSGGAAAVTQLLLPCPCRAGGGAGGGPGGRLPPLRAGLPRPPALAQESR
uniref:Ig-like domain-containing protein n=1 Tax=Cairina moschata TaxID=8855 RepID=A0A8C3CB47_CAIMO